MSRRCLVRGMVTAIVGLAVASSALAREGDESSVFVLADQAQASRERGDFERAETLYIRLMGASVRQFGKDSAAVANTFNNLGTLYREMGRYRDAEVHLKRARKLYDDQKDKFAAVNPMHNLSLLYRDQGRWAEAEPLERQILEIRRETFGAGNIQFAPSLNNLALLYVAMGQYTKAKPLYSQAIKVCEAFDDEGLDLATVLNNLGLLHRDSGEPNEAEPLFTRAINIYNKKARNSPEAVMTLANLGTLYTEGGKYARAEPLFLRARTIVEGPVHPDRKLQSSVLTGLASLYARTGKRKEALSLHQQVLGYYKETLASDHPAVASTHHQLGLLHAADKRFEKAGEALDKARAMARRYTAHVLPGLSEADQFTFLRRRDEATLHQALAMALRHGGAGDLAARSAGWVINAKGRVQEVLAETALLAAVRSDTPGGKARQDLLEVRRQLANLVIRPPGHWTAEQRQQRYDDLTKREEALLRACREGGLPNLNRNAVKVDDVRKPLGDGGVLIDLAQIIPHPPTPDVDLRRRPPARYAAWVTLAKGDIRLVDLGPSDKIDTAVALMRKALLESPKLIRAKGEPEAEKALREPLQELSKLVLHPLLPHVGKAKRWVVSPDGNLWLIPWEALLLPDGKYAVEGHSLSYVLSGRDLAGVWNFKGEVSRPLVVANPDYDLDAKTEQAQAFRLLGNRGGIDKLRGMSNLLRLGKVPRLPGTHAEAKAIQGPLSEYTKQTPRTRLDKEAIEGVVKAAKSPRALVLATHGFFLPDQRVKPGERLGEKAQAPPGWENPLLRCGLLFAGCNDATKRGAEDDGVLTGLEVVGMDLRGCELVVLSACETGLGDVQNGEGVAGLRQAFRLAGAESIVSTLWQVPDSSSAQLMALFFQNLAKGKRRADALREAQLKVIAERRDDSAAAHPLFWAAFTLTGR